MYKSVHYKSLNTTSFNIGYNLLAKDDPFADLVEPDKSYIPAPYTPNDACGYGADNNTIDNAIDNISDEYINKHIAKLSAKQSIKKRFVVGNIYKLVEGKQNKFTQPKIFKCVKFIYTIKTQPVYIVIMKLLNTANTYQKFALNQTDCAKYHIKYEPGLEVYSMDLNWKDITKSYTK